MKTFAILASISAAGPTNSARFSALGLGVTFYKSGLELDGRADVATTAEFVRDCARALFWGLSGVVVKQTICRNSIGGFDLTEHRGRRIVDLSALIASLNSDAPPSCPVFVLNWPVLLWNLVAIAKTGKVLLRSKDDVDKAKELMSSLKSAYRKGSVRVVDNPYVLMEEIDRSGEAIVIGGGSWLWSAQNAKTTQDADTTQHAKTHLLPICAEGTGAVFSKYMECLGYLLPDGQPKGDAMRDVRHLDNWIANRFRSEGFMTSSAAKAARVGLPCWVAHSEVLGDLPDGVGSLDDIEIIDRAVSPIMVNELAIF